MHTFIICPFARKSLGKRNDNIMIPYIPNYRSPCDPRGGLHVVRVKRHGARGDGDVFVRGMFAEGMVFRWFSLDNASCTAYVCI